MRLHLAIARSRAEILRCQRLIAETYNREYDVVFSSDRYDLDAKIEPWPHRYLVIAAGDELVATCGLYVRDTYVERFGQVTDADIEAVLAAARANGRFDPARKREVTKLVVSQARRGAGLGRVLTAAAHSRAFLHDGEAAPPLVVTCARRSIWNGLYHRNDIRTRVLRPFPRYKVHELYTSEADPMDSRLIIPELDVPARWYDLELPGDYDLADFGDPR